eukprot:84434-Amphidinium_carterae.2
MDAPKSPVVYDPETSFAESEPLWSMKPSTAMRRLKRERHGICVVKSHSLVAWRGRIARLGHPFR